MKICNEDLSFLHHLFTVCLFVCVHLFIHSFNQSLFISLRTHVHLFYTLGNNPMLLHCFNCFSFGHWELFQLSFYFPLTWIVLWGGAGCGDRKRKLQAWDLQPELAFLMVLCSSMEFQRPKNFIFEPRLPGHYKGIFVKV